MNAGARVKRIGHRGTETQIRYFGALEVEGWRVHAAASLADARALLAKLLVSQNQLEEAMRTVEEGLAQSQRESFFVANLHTVQGEIHEARATLADGAQGALCDSVFEYGVRDALLYTIGGGTNEIQRTLIALRGLDLPR